MPSTRPSTRHSTRPSTRQGQALEAIQVQGLQPNQVLDHQDQAQEHIDLPLHHQEEIILRATKKSYSPAHNGKKNHLPSNTLSQTKLASTDGPLSHSLSHSLHRYPLPPFVLVNVKEILLYSSLFAIYWDTWVRYRIPYSSWVNGYRFYNDYPYFIYNGYLHRYSNIDRCDYELVDGWTNETIDYFDNYQCNQGYDLCASDRDYYNRMENGYRYFCSERFFYDDSYDYGWDFDRDFYYDTY